MNPIPLEREESKREEKRGRDNTSYICITLTDPRMRDQDEIGLSVPPPRDQHKAWQWLVAQGAQSTQIPGWEHMPLDADLVRQDASLSPVSTEAEAHERCSNGVEDETGT